MLINKALTLIIANFIGIKLILCYSNIGNL